MKKRISVFVLICICLLVALLTFEITFVAVSGIYMDRNSTTTVSENGFLGEVLDGLEEVDGIYRNDYIEDLDDDQLKSYIIKGYVAGTNDKYGTYYSPDEYDEYIKNMTGDSAGIGVYVSADNEVMGYEILTVFSDSPAEKAGLVPGDYIIGAEDEYISDVGFEQILIDIAGEVGTDVDIIVLHKNDMDNPEVITMTRANIQIESVYGNVSKTDPEVGIVKIVQFYQGSTYEEFTKTVEDLLDKGCTKFVFDVRNNPGGELNAVTDTLDYLVPEGPIIRIFDADDNLVEQIDSDKKCFDYPITVLVNENTASAAELFTSTLRDYKMATIIGTTTYGKGTMQKSVPLSDSGVLSITYRYYKPPFSESYQGTGIEPDEVVEPNEAVSSTNLLKIAEEDDNQLIYAIKILNKQ